MSSAHSHRHFHPSHHHSHASHVISKAIGITVVFMLIEIIGGWWANSLALISDGFHMLTDVGAMMLSLVAVWMAKKPSTPRMTFGYHRAEILGALLSGLMIWLISGFLIYEAILRMQTPPEVKGPMVFFIALLGLFANILSMWMLHSTKDENINVRATYLHLLSDCLGSVAAVIAGAVLWLTGWRPIDPIITVIFAALMLVSSWSLVKEAIEILMESTPTHLDSQAVQADLMALPGVQAIHDLHIWSVSSGRLALSVHIVSPESESVLNPAIQMLEAKYQIIHTTIQIEHPDRFQSERCYDCMQT